MSPERCKFAAAYISGNGEYEKIFGIVQFRQLEDGVMVEAKVYGLPEENASGFFGFHIHGGGACTGEGIINSGGHYDPDGAMHPMHRGDLPPLLSCNGNAYLAVQTDRFTVKEIVGKTVIIHSGPDDFHSQPSGNPGIKIACGVIQCE